MINKSIGFGSCRPLPYFFQGNTTLSLLCHQLLTGGTDWTSSVWYMKPVCGNTLAWENPDKVFFCAPTTRALQAGILARLVSPPAVPGNKSESSEQLSTATPLFNVCKDYTKIERKAFFPNDTARLRWVCCMVCWVFLGALAMILHCLKRSNLQLNGTECLCTGIWCL